jgi:hypothetical protein
LAALAIVVVVLIGLKYLLNGNRQEMDPVHAHLIQAIANSLDHSVNSNGGKADYSGGIANRPIHRTLFRADYPQLAQQVDQWEATFSILPRQKQSAQKMMKASAQSAWPTLGPSTLGDYAFEYTQKNLMNPSPPTPWIALMPKEDPSQLWKVLSSSSGQVLYNYGSTLRGDALTEAQRQCEAVKEWVTSMFKSPDVEAWRKTWIAQNDLRVRISGKLQAIAVQPTLPRGKCQVCK